MAVEQLTVKDVAELTGVSEYTVRKKLREGEIKGERTSDREGYRVSSDDLIAYLQKAKKPIPAKLAGVASGASLGLALGASVAGGPRLLGPLLCAPFFLPLAAAVGGAKIGAAVETMGVGVIDGITSLVRKVNDVLRDKNAKSEEVLELSVGSLRHRIDALRYSIQALELKGDCLSVEEKQEILEGKAQIELLEQQINELKLKYELDQV